MFLGFYIDDRFKRPIKLSRKIKIETDCTLTESEVELFNISMSYLQNRIIRDNLDFDMLPIVNILFTTSGHNIKFSTDESILGVNFTTVFYFMDRLRKSNDKNKMMFVFLEEMVHIFWNINDEIEVKYKVLEIIQEYNPLITIDVLKGWKFYGYEYL